MFESGYAYLLFAIVVSDLVSVRVFVSSIVFGFPWRLFK